MLLLLPLPLLEPLGAFAFGNFITTLPLLPFWRVKGPEADADSGEILLDLLVLFSFIICEEPILLPLADVEEAEEGSLGIAELLLKLLFGILTRSTGLADNFLLVLTVC